MIRVILPSAIALTALLAGRAGAHTEPPLRVSTCFMGPLGPMAPVDGGPASDGRTLHVAFTNTATERMERIAFSVTHGGRRYSVVDAGRFAPEALVEHRFFGFADDRADAGAADACTIERVRFAGGREWVP